MPTLHHAADIERDIVTAFADVPRPAQEALVSHRCCECDELAGALSPYTARELPATVLATHVWDLPLLSDEGKHYYLPAWLAQGLRPGGESAVDAVLYALDTDHRWSPWPPYSVEQWLAVDRWLAHVAATTEGELADDIARVREKLPR